MKKYIIKITCTCVLAMLFLVGCGTAKVPEVVDVTSLVIDREGEVTSYLLDEFDKEYYSVAELTDMAVKEAAAYNTEHQAGEVVPVTVDKVEKLPDGSDKVVVKHIYDSTSTFADYNGNVLFYGTVSEAVDAGYSLSVTMKNVKDNTLYTEAQLMQNQDKYLLITDARAVIYCPGKVTYVSEGAEYQTDGSVDASLTENIVMVLMK